MSGTRGGRDVDNDEVRWWREKRDANGDGEGQGVSEGPIEGYGACWLREDGTNEDTDDDHDDERCM